MNAWYYIDVWRKGVQSTWGADPNWRRVDSYGPIRTSEDNSKWWEQHFWMQHYSPQGLLVRRFEFNGSVWVLKPSPVSLA